MFAVCPLALSLKEIVWELYAVRSGMGSRVGMVSFALVVLQVEEDVVELVELSTVELEEVEAVLELEERLDVDDLEATEVEDDELLELEALRVEAELEAEDVVAVEEEPRDEVLGVDTAAEELDALPGRVEDPVVEGVPPLSTTKAAATPITTRVATARAATAGARPRGRLAIKRRRKLSRRAI